jgi:acyl-coenzyme A thioesterase PaaI-like protein
VHVVRYEDDELEAWTRFGPFHAGSGGAVHGGAVSLLFDDALGRLADLGHRSPSRTASLQVDYRSITPVDERLAIHVAVEEKVDRKRWLRGTLRHGKRLCAEARGLFLELLPGQP